MCLRDFVKLFGPSTRRVTNPTSLVLTVFALGRNYDVEPVSSSPERGRSRSRSRSRRLIRPPPPDEESSDVDGETELQGICHEESPPSVSDLYIGSQIWGGHSVVFQASKFLGQPNPHANY